MELPQDKDGYLLNIKDWNEQIAQKIAEQEKLSLTNDHWEVLLELRNFYDHYQRHPTLRVLINQLIKQDKMANITSTELYKLFPDGPIKQGSKIAGLPKPASCI